jgi:uncharacterized protein (TIGR03000 family)
MYSLVLMTAMATAGDSAAFGKRGGCHGCSGAAYACYGSCYGSYYGSCYGSCSGSCHGYASACYGSGYSTGYTSACYGSCYGTSYQANCFGSCYGSSCHGYYYAWSLGGGGCFGGAAGCYSLAAPVGGGPGYGIWVDPNKGPTVMPPRVGHLYHGGNFYGRMWHPFDGHGADYRGAGYYDCCHGMTVPAWAGGNGTGYIALNGAGGYDYTIVDKVYSPEAADEALRRTPRRDSALPTRAEVTVQLPPAARLSVDGLAVAGDGGTRLFHTPDLADGQAYYYEMKADMDVAGRTVSQSLKVVVKAGASVTARFDELLAVADKVAKDGAVVAAGR